MKKIFVFLFIVVVIFTGCNGEGKTNNEKEKSESHEQLESTKTYKIEVDVTNDGESEVIQLSVPTEAINGVRNFKVEILQGNSVIWTSDTTDHIGDTKSYWIVEKDAKKYILEYQAYYHQNTYKESYILFELTNSREIIKIEEKSFLADSNSVNLFEESYINVIVDFHESITELIESGIIIFDINSSGSKYIYSENNSNLLGYDDMLINPVNAWLSDERFSEKFKEYEFSNSDTLFEKLKKYRAGIQQISGV